MEAFESSARGFWGAPTVGSPSTTNMGVEEQFKKAVELIQGMPKNSPVKVSQDVQLKVYSLYKQATVGDVNTSRPGMLDISGRYKWDAWNKLKGKSSEDAKKEYVQTFFEMFEPYKDDAEFAKYIEEVKSLA
ncbi:ACB1 [Malassezia furfur]|nr:ACB1 [Malassezia furfur]